MTRLLLRLINAPALIFFTMVGVAVQTSLFSFWFFEFLQPDVVLLMVVWCALRRQFTEGGIITLIIGNIAELHSAAPQGTFLITYMLIYLLVRLSSKWVVIQDLSSLVMVSLFAAVFSKMVGLIILYLLGVSASPWQHTLLLLFPGAVATGVAGNWVYRWMEKFDWITFKNIRAEQALEDELQMQIPGS